MNTKKTDKQICTAQKSVCQTCGNAGKILYQNLTDRLFGVPGNWTLKKCIDPKCGLVWLDPVPCEKELIKLYRSYYTTLGMTQKKRLKRSLGCRKYGNYIFLLHQIIGCVSL